MANGQPSSHNVFLQIASEKRFMKTNKTKKITHGYTKKEMVYPLLLQICCSTVLTNYPLCFPLRLLLGSHSVYTQITTPAAGVFTLATFVGQIGPLSSAPKENWAASRSRVAVPKGPE